MKTWTIACVLLAPCPALLACGGQQQLGTAYEPPDAAAYADALAHGPACGEGSWILSTSATSCPGCFLPADSVGLLVSGQIAVEGGLLSDSQGNMWQFDPATCSATLAGDCNAIDTVLFDSGAATCQASCGGCPACAVPCSLQP